MSKRPNIIVIFTDQQRADTIGYEINGNKISPNLEKIGEEGVKFNYSFTPQPVCGPARACLQTGVYGTQCGIYRNGLALNAQEQNNGNNLATWLRESGYD